VGAKGKTPPKDNIAQFMAGQALLRQFELFKKLAPTTSIVTNGQHPLPKDAWLQIERDRPRYGSASTPILTIYINVWRRATPPEWANVLAQAELHLVMDHVDPDQPDPAWRMACEAKAVDFLRHLGIGHRPQDLANLDATPPGRDVHELAQYLRDNPQDDRYFNLGLAGKGQATWICTPIAPKITEQERKNNALSLANGIRRALETAIASTDLRATNGDRRGYRPNSMAQLARSWFVAEFPLLAALAASFEIVEDDEICDNLNIAIAAIHSELRAIYIRPHYPLTFEQMKFVMAHELLHVGLRHEERQQGRDPFLWNVACDYAINDWLVEAGIGILPSDGALFDIELRGFSSEEIYDRLTTDLRMMRKLQKLKTFRGFGETDVLTQQRSPVWWRAGPGCDLDAFYRRALAEGLELHLKTGDRGYLPGGLIEEIRALQQPPIPWDVKLAQWLDGFFQPIEHRRTFARASRRQASTPDIARPAWVRPYELELTRTFAVVLDSSGSMDRMLLGKAVGAIASYAMSRDVTAVRLVLCDASPHDRGFINPEELLGRVEITGRGGTILQPGIQCILESTDFPKDGPLLVITDGVCDTLQIPREHAFLLPEGASLPFITRAPMFRFE
jgi:predicted metal-dependent peptidase